MRVWYLIPCLVALTACAPAPEPEAPAPVDPALAAAQAEAEIEAAEEARAAAEQAVAECKAVDLLDLVGQPQAALAGLLPDTARVIEPGGIVTQDYLPQRVNVDLDGEGNVARIWCG